MDITVFLTLFVLGFVIGLMSRLFYAKMTGQLQAKKPDNDKVRYVSPKSDDSQNSQLQQPAPTNKKVV